MGRRESKSLHRRLIRWVLFVYFGLFFAPTMTWGIGSFNVFGRMAQVFRQIGASSISSVGWVTGSAPTIGSGDGQLDAVSGTALDLAHDALYVIDAGFAVYKYKVSTGAFVGAVGKTAGSTGTCPTSGVATSWCTGGVFVPDVSDGAFMAAVGIAFDSVHGAIYVSDVSNNKISKLNATTGAFIGAIGETSASTGTCPVGVATGWCTGGIFQSDAAGPDGAFNYLAGIAFDSTNDALYVADNNQVSKFRASTGAFVGAIGRVASSTGTCIAGTTATGWCTGGSGFSANNQDGGFVDPVGVAYDSANNALYVTDFADGKISKITATTGAFVGAVGRPGSSTGTCVANTAATGWCTGGNFNFAGSSGDGAYSGPTSIAFDSLNNAIYFADTGNNRIVKIKATTGAFQGALGQSVSTTGSCPSLGVASTWCTGGSFVSARRDGSFGYSQSMTVDSTNNILYVDDGIGGIDKLTASTGAFLGRTGAVIGGTVSTWQPNISVATGAVDGAFLVPDGVAFDATNDALYIADAVNNNITKIKASTGAFIGSIGRLVSSSGTCASSGVASGWCTGGLFVAGASDGMFHAPGALAYDSANDALYVVDSNNFRIVKIKATTGAFVGSIGRTSATAGTCPSSGSASGWCTGGTFIASNNDGAFQSPTSVAYDSTNNAIYVTDSGSGRVVKIVATTGAFVGAIGKTTSSTGTCPSNAVATGWCTGGFFPTSGGSTNDGAFFSPNGVAYDSIHNALYIADETNNRVVKVTATTGAFVGAIGVTASSTGTCPATGITSGWCTKGIFSSTNVDGGFGIWLAGLAYDSAHDWLYVDNGPGRVSKYKGSTGAYIGALGKFSSTTGSCPATGVAINWCQGGVIQQGTGDGAFFNASGLALDSAHGYIYSVDYTSGQVMRISP